MMFWKRSMSCEAYVNLMSRYVDGDLTEEEERAWKKHFDSCRKCHRFFESFQSSLELLAYLKDQSCPVCVTDRLHQFMEEKLKTVQTGS